MALTPPSFLRAGSYAMEKSGCLLLRRRGKRTKRYFVEVEGCELRCFNVEDSDKDSLLAHGRKARLTVPLQSCVAVEDVVFALDLESLDKTRERKRSGKILGFRLAMHDARALTFVAEAGGNANAWATFMRGHIWNASTSLLSRGGGPGARTTSLKLLLHKTSTGTGTGTCTNAGIGTSKGISGLVVDVNTAEALPQDLSVLLYDSTGLPPHSFSYFRYAPDTGAKEALPATLAKQPLQKWLGQGNAERVQVHVRVASDPPPSATRLKFT